MPSSSSQTFLTVLTLLLATACSRTAEPSEPAGAGHEAIRGDVAALKADTAATKSNTEVLKTDVAIVKADSASAKTQLDTLLGSVAAVKDDGSALRADTGTIQAGLITLRDGIDSLKADTTSIQGGVDALEANTSAIADDTMAMRSDVTAMRSDVTALKDSVGTGLSSQLSGVQTSLGTPPSGHSLYTTLMAARRYSKTCNPDTDTWLRSAWPGLSNAEITDACQRDGRWHYLGTMLDFLTGAITLPDAMEVGLTSYSRSIAPVTVNGWDRGTRLCLPPIAVGNGHIVGTTSLIHECVTLMDNRFTVTHRVVDQTTADYSQRDYTGYSGGAETALPCTTGGGWTSCGNNESVASHWQIYVRQ
jgi:hypothetical protein